MTKLTFEVLMQAVQNKVLDFGPLLAANVVCPAWTVEKLSLWEHTTMDKFEMVAVRASYMAKARAQGVLYNMTDEQVYQLDRERGHGVHCDRRLLPIMVMIQEPNPMNPLLPDLERFVQTMAYVYIGKSERWVHEIQSDTSGYRAIDGVKVPFPITYKQPDRYPNAHPQLNGSYCFLPPPSDYGRVYTVDPRVLKKLKRKNRETGRNLWYARVRNFLRGDDDQHHSMVNITPIAISSQDIKGRIP